MFPLKPYQKKKLVRNKKTVKFTKNNILVKI